MASLAGPSGEASLAGANQLNKASVEPWNVHSAAAAVLVFFGFTGLTEVATVLEAAVAAEASEATPAIALDAATAPEAAEATDTADAACAPEVGRGAFAACAAEAAAEAATSEAVTTCSIDPSTTTREPSMPTPLWLTLSVSGDDSASLLRINCSHASEFL